MPGIKSVAVNMVCRRSAQMFSPVQPAPDQVKLQSRKQGPKIELDALRDDSKLDIRVHLHAVCMARFVGHNEPRSRRPSRPGRLCLYSSLSSSNSRRALSIWLQGVCGTGAIHSTAVPLTRTPVRMLPEVVADQPSICAAAEQAGAAGTRSFARI